MKHLALLAALAALAAGCAGDSPATPTPGDTNPEGLRPAVEVQLALVDRTPGAGVPPTTMGIVPGTLELALDVPVNLTVLNDGSMVHDLRIDLAGEADVMTEDLEAGASQTVLFTPDTPGEYEMWCTIGGDGPLGHRAQGMRGTVTVA